MYCDVIQLLKQRYSYACTVLSTLALMYIVMKSAIALFYVLMCQSIFTGCKVVLKILLAIHFKNTKIVSSGENFLVRPKWIVANKFSWEAFFKLLVGKS